MERTMVSSELTFLDYFFFLVKRKKRIIINALIVGVVSLGISFLLPKWYRAEGLLAPPQKDMSLLGGVSQILSNVPMSRFLGMSGITEEVGLYLAILDSRTVMESVAIKHNLTTIYKKRNLEESVNVLRKNVDFGVEDEGSVKIRVLDKDPRRAADMVNSFIYYLDSLNIQLNIQRARNNRIFIEKRLRENQKDMEEAERALMVFQQKYNMIALEEQTEAAIMVAAELQAQILASKFELGILSSAFGKNHSGVLRLEEQIASIERELKKLRFGENLPREGKVIRKAEGGEVLIPLFEIPEIGQQYLNLFKEVQVQNKLYLFLIQEYEQAKIQEIKDTPTVQIIDKAVPPIKKAKPKRALIVLSSMLAGTIFYIVFIFIFEYLKMLKKTDPDRYRKLQRISGQFRIRPMGRER